VTAIHSMKKEGALKEDGVIDLGIMGVVLVLCGAILHHAMKEYRQEKKADAWHILMVAVSNCLAAVNGTFYESALSRGLMTTPLHLLYRCFQNGFFFLSVYHAVGLTLELTEQREKAAKKRFAGFLLVVGWLMMVGLYSLYRLSLLSVDARFQRDLERQTLSAELRLKLFRHGIPLSQGAVVLMKAEGSRWLITDGKKTFTVRKEKGQLNISYRFQRAAMAGFYAYTGVRSVLFFFFCLRILAFYHRAVRSPMTPLARHRMKLMEYTCLCGILYGVALLWPAERSLSPRPSLLIVMVGGVFLYLGYVMPGWFGRLLLVSSSSSAGEQHEESMASHTALVDLLRAKRILIQSWVRRFGQQLDFSAAQIDVMHKAAYHLGSDWLHGHRSAPAEGEETPISRSIRTADYVERVLREPAVARILRHLSDRWDGWGNPSGALEGEAIPVESRVLAVVEAFVNELSATEDETQALARVQAGAGRQFDPELVKTLEALLKQEMRE
jgi:hypothetical protein